MDSTTDAAKSRFPLTITLFLFLMILTGIACNKAGDAPGNAKATPANTAAPAKPTEPEAKKETPPVVGKEIKPATGPALKSIEPAEGTILGGVLNDIAKELPQPDAAAAKTANASGTVTVEVIVNEKGEVSTLSVVSGPQPLWSAASAAARKARFDPPLHDGKPVKVAGILTYEFKK
jgi:TonB family protein